MQGLGVTSTDNTRSVGDWMGTVPNPTEHYMRVGATLDLTQFQGVTAMGLAFDQSDGKVYLPDGIVIFRENRDPANPWKPVNVAADVAVENEVYFLAHDIADLRYALYAPLVKPNSNFDIRVNMLPQWAGMPTEVKAWIYDKFGTMNEQVS